jgi:hypothetical protein
VVPDYNRKDDDEEKHEWTSPVVLLSVGRLMPVRFYRRHKGPANLFRQTGDTGSNVKIICQEITGIYSYKSLRRMRNFN